MNTISTGIDPLTELINEVRELRQRIEELEKEHKDVVVKKQSKEFGE